MTPTFQKQAEEPAPRVLIVKPERAYLPVLARRIADSGYRVALADSVESAVAELYRLPVDIVLCELTGSRFNGRELLRIVRADSKLRDIPFLIFSGRNDHPAAIEALREGADAIVKKPFHFEVLCARLGRELQRKQALDELRSDNQALDARVIERAIAIGELRDQLASIEADRRRLLAMVGATDRR